MTTLENLLVTLMEECDELSQRCSKAARFGLREVQPGQALDNAQRMAYEYSHVVATYQLLIAGNWVLPPTPEQIAEKTEKVLKYMEYSKAQGTLNQPSQSATATTLSAKALEAIGWLCSTEADGLMCEEAREIIRTKFGDGVDAELKARFAGKPPFAIKHGTQSRCPWPNGQCICPL